MTLRRILLSALALVLLLAAVVAARTTRFAPAHEPVEPVARVPVPPDAVPRMAASLRFPTISHQDPAAFDSAAFAGFREFLQESFPRVHAELRLERVEGHALLYTWSGTEPGLDPMLLMGHYDVVPVEPGTEERWRHPPFAGVVAEGEIWGRGAFDNKSSVMGTLEAVEMLLEEGFRPRRTVYLAYGHDEEVGGAAGAARIAALLRERGVRLEMVLDEGGAVGLGILPDVGPPTALVGIAEKGYLSVELTARGAGGHSSMPPGQSTVGIVSAAIARLEKRPPPARLTGATLEMFRSVGPYMGTGQRAVLANTWLFRPLLLSRLQRSDRTYAMVRTTTAATMFTAGTKDNVLPGHASAVVNFRILPGDSIAGVLEHVRRAVRDPRVEVRPLGPAIEPSPVSSTSSESFRVLAGTVRQVFPEAVVTPYLVMGATDARHYRDLSENVYRFLPVVLTAEGLGAVHGTDERIGAAAYEDAVRFYRLLLRNAAG